MITGPIRALAAGTVAGVALSALITWAFVKGCPIFDIEHDTIHGF
ncbi:hypothetical protein [Mycobacterium sp. CnD-18-1]|mgnify:CR=1 FL=1|nr:hypothetical protein [Mycobacterium sp. CnD-18-1]